MKRYMEAKEIQAQFILCYFMYGKLKYGSKGYSKERLAGMSVYKSVMNLYRPFVYKRERIRSDVILRRFELLRQQAAVLADCPFKKVFFELLEQLNPHHCLQES